MLRSNHTCQQYLNTSGETVPKAIFWTAHLSSFLALLSLLVRQSLVHSIPVDGHREILCVPSEIWHGVKGVWEIIFRSEYQKNPLLENIKIENATLRKFLNGFRPLEDCLDWFWPFWEKEVSRPSNGVKNWRRFWLLVLFWRGWLQRVNMTYKKMFLRKNSMVVDYTQSKKM